MRVVLRKHAVAYTGLFCLLDVICFHPCYLHSHIKQLYDAPKVYMEL